MKFEDSKTRENLARAFAGECQAGARYQFAAKKAEQEGYGYISVLLKTQAKNEMSHAKAYWDLIVNNSAKPPANIEITGGYPFKDGDLLQNLKDTMETEHSESDNIYPSFAKVAEDEGFPDVAKMFTLISTVENCHYLLLKQLYEGMKSGKLYKKATPIKWKCNECGFEHTSKQPWSICPICKYEQGYVQIPIDTGGDSN